MTTKTNTNLNKVNLVEKLVTFGEFAVAIALFSFWKQKKCFRRQIKSFWFVCNKLFYFIKQLTLFVVDHKFSRSIFLDSKSLVRLGRLYAKLLFLSIEVHSYLLISHNNSFPMAHPIIPSKFRYVCAKVFIENHNAEENRWQFINKTIFSHQSKCVYSSRN